MYAQRNLVATFTFVVQFISSSGSSWQDVYSIAHTFGTDPTLLEDGSAIQSNRQSFIEAQSKTLSIVAKSSVNPNLKEQTFLGKSSKCE